MADTPFKSPFNSQRNTKVTNLGLNTMYIITDAGVTALAKNLINNDETSTEYAMRDYISSLVFYPFKVQDVIGSSWVSPNYDIIEIGGEQVTCTVSGVTYSCNGYKVADQTILTDDYPGLMIVLPPIQITPHFDSFIDYKFCDYQIYLPYVGFVQLRPEQILNRKLVPYYALDLASGSSTIYLVDATDDLDHYVVYSTTAQLGYKLDVTNSDVWKRSIEEEKNTIGLAVSAIASFVMLGVGVYTGSAATTTPAAIKSLTMIGGALAGMGKTAVEGYNTLLDAQHGSLSVGSMTPSNANITSPNVCYVIIRRPKVISYYDSNEFKHLSGKPCLQYLALSTLTGFTLVADIHLEDLGSQCTDPEREMIDKLLRTGVIL